MKEDQDVLERLGLLEPRKQGILIIIVSVLTFFSMLVLNGNYVWNYSPEPMCIPTRLRCDGVIGLGLNMAEWAVVSFIGVSVGLVRIFVINSK